MATLNGFILLTATHRSTTAQRNTLLRLLRNSGYPNVLQTHKLSYYILCINYENV